MEKKIKIYLNTFIFIVSIIIGIYLTYQGLDKNWSILFVFCSSLLTLCISVFLEQKSLPKKFSNIKKNINQIEYYSSNDELIELLYNTFLNTIDDYFLNLSKGYYTGELNKIPNISIETISNVQQEAFATFLDYNTNIYNENSGKIYLDYWYKKAKELKNDKIIRLFIIDDINKCSVSTQNIISDHVKNGLNVKIISKKEIINFNNIDNVILDFAIFDNKYLMTVEQNGNCKPVKLNIYIHNKNLFPDNEKIFNQYLSFKKYLLDNSKNYDEFIDVITKPLNKDFWDKWLVSNGNELKPPHGLSNNDASLMVNQSLSLLKKNKNIKVCILGMTSMLINICCEKENISKIILLDQSNVNIQNNNCKKIKKEVGNWLTYKSNDKFDIILGDEALNNLSIKQYKIFFKNMHSLLNENGILILRTMGIFTKQENYFNKEHLRQYINKYDDVGESLKNYHIIKYLHNEELGYDKKNYEIDNLKYNKIIEDFIKIGLINDNNAKKWFFPEKDSERLVLSSPPFEIINNNSKEFFEIYPLIQVDSNYIEKDKELNNYYKIIKFKKKSLKNTRRKNNKQLRFKYKKSKK